MLSVTDGSRGLGGDRWTLADTMSGKRAKSCWRRAAPPNIHPADATTLKICVNPPV